MTETDPKWNQNISMKGALEMAESLQSALDLITDQYTGKLDEMRKTSSHYKSEHKKLLRMKKQHTPK